MPFYGYSALQGKWILETEKTAAYSENNELLAYSVIAGRYLAMFQSHVG